MHDTQFCRLLDHFGYSWDGYRRVRKGVKKRIVRHMQTIGCHDIEAYIAAIRKHSDTRLDFEHCMTVSISRVFRDRGLWEVLQQRILPALAREARQAIKVWFAGCAAGEEVYSFKIVWEQLQKARTQIPNMHIVATDMHPEYLRRAQTAVYPRSSMREVPDSIRGKYFEKKGRGRFKLKPGIKEEIVWQIHDLLSDPPGTAFDLIFMRNNLLTYYDAPIKIPALKQVVACLGSGGFLIIGRHEKLPVEIEGLLPIDKSLNIYQSRCL